MDQYDPYMLTIYGSIQYIDDEHILIKLIHKHLSSMDQFDPHMKIIYESTFIIYSQSIYDEPLWIYTHHLWISSIHR